MTMTTTEKKIRDQLTSINTADAGMFYMSVKAAAAIVTAGYALQNPTLKNEAGDIATALTVYGAAYLASPEGTDPATVEGSRTDLHSHVDASAAPVVTTLVGRSGTAFSRATMSLPDSEKTRKSSYPTDELKAPTVNPETGEMEYDGIFLPPTAKITDPAKAYPAVASSANKRHKNNTPPRKFTSRVMDGAVFGQPGITGVAIFRTA